MLDRLAPCAHGTGVPIEPRLHRFAVNTRGRSATSSGVGHSRRGRDVRRQII